MKKQQNQKPVAQHLVRGALAVATGGGGPIPDFPIKAK